MSILISRLMLAMLMFPLAGLVYTTMVVISDVANRPRAYPRNSMWIIAGMTTWAFIAIYWTLLWRRAVKWSGQRMVMTLAAAAGSVLMGVLVGAVVRAALGGRERDFSPFLTTTVTPLFWLVATCFLWRDVPGNELHEQGKVVCPTCGYDLRGLTTTRCPECGAQLTLDALIAGQPENADGELRSN